MKQAIVVAGLAFGDEGKGTMTDYLTRRYNAGLVVRYNGGPQAAHNVVTDDGRHFTFSQFASGHLAGAKTFLSKYMLIEPNALLAEAMCLWDLTGVDPHSKISVDGECVIITPWQKIANRLREVARGANRHGSVGVGVGEARGDSLKGLSFRVCDMADTSKLEAIYESKRIEMLDLVGSHNPLYELLVSIRPAYVHQQYAWAFARIRQSTWEEESNLSDTVVFEGAQGVLLDEKVGFHPHTTWTDCTFGNADKLIGDVPTTKIGVIRSYFTRHGAGPFPTEDSLAIPENHNKMCPYMGQFRLGHFDGMLAKYAIDMCGGLDGVAITHADLAPPTLLKLCAGYDNWDGAYTAKSLSQVTPIYHLGGTAIEYFEETRVPVLYLSYGPKACNKYSAAIGVGAL